MSNQSKTQDPKEMEAKPPFPEQEQEPVGLESEMEPRPDYGEESYRGSGKLQGKAAIITGGDSGIGRAVALAFAPGGADVAISYLPEEEKDGEDSCRRVRVGPVLDHEHGSDVMPRGRRHQARAPLRAAG